MPSLHLACDELKASVRCSYLPFRCPYLPFRAASARKQPAAIRLSYGFRPGAVASTIFVLFNSALWEMLKSRKSVTHRHAGSIAWSPHGHCTEALIMRRMQDFRWSFRPKKCTMIVGSWDNRTALRSYCKVVARCPCSANKIARI